MYTIRLLSLFSTFSVLSSLKIIRPTNFQVIKISENTEPGIIFSAVVENPTYDQLNYRLQQFGSNFYLDGKNLMTAREFDYEVTGDRMHDLTLEVSDSYTTVECSFQIQVTNINDNKPVLSGSFRGYVKEEQPVGESVIFKSLSAVDDDADDELRYSLSGDDSNKFSISKSVIDIQTSAKFDRDIDKKYYDKLLLTVTDLANHTDSNRLNITIIDINDNAPKCTPDTYMVEINEDVSIGSDAISIKCQDMDEGRNGYISMHFQSTASSDKFEIRPDGRIKIKSILDYESLENFNSFLKLTVFVKDNPRDSKDSLTSTVTVNVKILPVNEYSPTWVEFLPASLNNVYYVSENAVIGTVILTVKAEDQDRGPNCFIIYRLVSNSESSAKFRLDSITGELSTKSFLDRDVKSGGRHSYKLQVEAIDNEGETSGVSQLTINLLEYNDNAPTFSKSVYGVTIKESMPVGGNVVLLSADDIDESTNLSLYIVDGDKNKFGFHSSVSGQIILSKSIELDGLRPDPSLYSLKVIVKDGDTNEKTGSCRVLISVESANDNTPAFEKTKTIMIPEDHPVGDSVIILTAKDLDSGKDGEIIYSIIGGDPTKTFSINSNTGEIHLVKPLDFETMSDPVFYLNVSAQDRGTPMKSSNTIQQIDIENVNDNLPICSSTFIKEYINDNATAGYKITRLKCTDRDKIRALTCYINGKNKDLFSMNTDGDLLLKRGVDYDSGPSHFSAEITVTDGKHRILVFLMLVLLPTNDARPVILPASDNVTLKENLPPGTTVTHVTATDADAAPHNIVKYQLLGASNKFGIDRSSGEIRLLSYLDYEVQTSYQLKVVVTDGGGLKAAGTVTVQVEDVNDNSPVCSVPSNVIYLNEDTPIGHDIVILHCFDADSDLYNRIKYRLQTTTPMIPFRVSSAGIVQLSGSLDYDIERSYVFQVLVGDNGLKQTTVVLNIQVTENEANSPIFVSNFSTSIMEDAPIGYFVVDITATSKQHQAIKAGKLIYSIHSGNDAKLFRINSHTGCVTLDGNLDREKQASYVLLIKAVEKSKIQNSAMAALTIVVADVNDNAPSCQPSAFSLTLTEDQKLNTPLQAFFCEDLDEKGNLSLTYSVTSSEPNVFDMKRQILVLKSDFDLAKNPHGYHLYVTVSDSVHELKITGYVKVTAVNKFPPVFAQNHYTVRFPEGTSIGHQLIKISATDRDHPNIGNDIIKYSIVKSGDKLPFHIDKQSGTIFVDSVLDRENIEKYNFQVEAVDESLRTVCDITVIVTDINDNPPYFNPASYSATVSEVDSLGTKVVDVRAYDNDTGSNAIITYSIVDGNSAGKFSIDATTGRISITNSLDYETTEINSYILTTEATDLFGGDGALSSTAVVIVQIRPVNEFPPVFQNQAYSVVVQETVTIGSILLQVSATDEDKGNDGQLIYTMPSHQLFSLERTTGQLKLKHSLDFEKTPQFILNVTAIDKGTVAKSATTKVVINVENVNEEGPKCLENFISVSVPENQQIGSSFVSLSCNDSDSGRFGEISFSIMSVNGVMNNGPFAVDNSGNLKLITSLDFEKSEKILIHIAVQDGGIPPKDTIIIISVQIIDINEAAPVFEDFNTTITIPESVSIGTVISRISASDVDIKDCITYHLTQTSEKFQLDSITGDLEVKSNLDFETKNIYLLPLKAVDSGQNPKPRTSEITLTVILTDINDSPPVFSQNLYTKTIREDTPIDSVLVTLTVSDNDSSENAIANFTVIGDTKNFFRASRDSSGNCNIILTSLEGADYEQNTSRVFKVKATDTGGLSSETTVIFQIQPLNEHAPVILNRARTLTVDENCTAGSQLTVVNAIDPDKGKDGQIHYRLVKDFAKFTIASKSGEIIIQNELDREEREFYQLEVIAIDEGQDPSAFSTTLTLSIHVNDVNDNRPSCQQEHYFVQIREDEPVGTEVLHLVCSDNDKDPAKKNNVLTYAITSGNERMAFSMNSSSGLLSTVTSLDRESVSSYELSIQVSDKGSSPLSVDLVLQIRIEDVNDNLPVFSPPNYSSFVFENTSVNSFLLNLTATDKDTGAAGSIFYSILSGNIKNQFMLDSVSGELRLLIGLDREDISSYDLLIQASDKGFPPLKTLCHVTLTVLDINDNAPICTSSYIKVILAENKPLASVVTNVECNDEDSGSNAIVSYKIISGNHENSFAIDGQTGMITVKKNLDAERNQSLLLGIEASDGFYKSEVRVDISISDINETPPQFQPPGPYKVSISEDSAIGSTVFQVTAIDEDVTSTSVLYSLSTTQNSVFIIDRKTGIIQLNSRLDRDTKSLYILQVEASDNSPRQPLSQTVDVSVVVTDVNDNYPQCFPPFLFSLLETTPFPLDISQLNCQDKDPSSPELSYRIENANEAEMFRIDEKTGLVQLVKALDYERAKIHILRVNVSDNGVPRLLTKVLITIEVRPVNDNAPTFSPFFVRRVSVEENVPLGISLLKVNVKDADVGEDHGLVSLSIEAGDQYGNFYIDSKSGSLSLIRYLDRETKAIFNLTIIARDCIHDIGVPLTSTTTLIVSVMDVNDNYPQFSQNSFLLKVNENAKPGSKLLTFQVQDEDTGLRGKTTLAIVEGNEKNIFSIINSHLLLHRNLDYETKPFFRLKIKASDRGSEPLSSFCHVNIEVIPRNEFSPAFLEKNSSLVLRETVPVGTIVCKVNVSDKDGSLNGVLNFSIISSTPLNAPISAFELDQKSGEISLVSKLDFETMPDIFNLVVKATDQAESDDTPFSSTLILSVTILNENDNPPIFTQNSFSFEVRENSPLGIYIDQITARDMDSGSFGKINYTIVDNTHDFGIDPLDGKLYLNSTLDYEQKQLYFLTVEVRDEGFPSLSATCLVKIAVIDVNDNAPAFPLSEQSVTVIEDVAQDTVIFKLHSSDADSFKSGNNQVQYKLFESFPSRNYFSIDAFSGEIHIKQRLDRETIPRHKLIILAVDQGSPQLSGTTTLTVIVEDVNDNSPVIKGDYKRRIPEDTLPGSLAFKISAFDADIGINAALSFEIVDGNTNSDFEIDKSSGYLFVNNTLDREQRSTYRLRISVTDQGLEVQRQGFNTVEIIVTDINDNTPVFLNNSYTFTISENLPKMTPVGKIDAVDADEGSNAALKFRIFYMLQGPGDFVMDSGSGIISTKKELDRELVPIYRLWCEVSDSGTPSLSAFTEVRIVVLDENDNEPIFDKTSYSVRILENTPVGSTAMELNIIDLDINKAGKITLHFSLNSNDLDAAKYYFEIVYQPPRLVLRRSIDREKLDNFDFILTAQDGGVPSLSSEASVSVHIDDVNDNRPHFSPVFFNQEASRDISCEKVLTRVSAVDQDLGDNGRISYYFVQNKYNYVFEINDVSGEIKMQMKGWKNKYIMIIKAKDWGIPQLVSDNSATLRLDTFNPSEALVSIYLDISLDDFNLKKKLFTNLLTSLIQVVYPTGKFKIWCVQEIEPVTGQAITAKRRLTADERRRSVVAYIYCLKSNITDVIENFPKEKDFCSTDEALSFLTINNEGEISVALEGPVWDDFNILDIQPYNTDVKLWSETSTGKITIAFIIVFLLVLMIVLFFLFRQYKRMKKKTTVIPVTTAIDANKKGTDKSHLLNVSGKNKNILKDGNTSKNTNIKRIHFDDDFSLRSFFSGRTIDPVTGKLYEYNKKTQERRWVTK